MIAKNIKGKSFGGCVRYVMNDTAELLKAEGVFADNAESIIRSFAMQRSGRSEITRPVGHIPMSFAPEDRERMTNDFMMQLAKEYMQEMGIGNTQYIIVRHHNTDNEHLHIVYNRIDNDLKLISVNNDYKRNIAVCKKIKDRHNLTYGKGKERVNQPKLQGADRAKYEIYDAMKSVLPKSHTIEELAKNLKPYGITLCLKYRRGSEIIDGVSFDKNGYKFKGSEIDRKFSYNGILKLFKALSYLEQERQKNPPLRKKVPIINGVKLSFEQWTRMQNGESIWIENMTSKAGRQFSAYASLSKDKETISFFKTPLDREQNIATPLQEPQPQQQNQANEQNYAISEMASAIGGLLDLPLEPSTSEAAEEAEFRRQMQRKKKKGRRM